MSKPYCERCNSNINVVWMKNSNKYRCCFCGRDIVKSGQTKLSNYTK